MTNLCVGNAKKPIYTYKHNQQSSQVNFRSVLRLISQERKIKQLRSDHSYLDPWTLYESVVLPVVQKQQLW